LRKRRRGGDRELGWGRGEEINREEDFLLFSRPLFSPPLIPPITPSPPPHLKD